MNNDLYTLIPLEDFKGLLSIDDRDDRLARFSLVTATHTIEGFKVMVDNIGHRFVAFTAVSCPAHTAVSAMIN